MEKFKTELELEVIIQETFDFNKDADKLYVSADGQCFLEQGKNAAEFHKRRTGFKYTSVNRSDFEKKSKPVIQKEEEGSEVNDVLESGVPESDAQESDERVDTDSEPTKEEEKPAKKESATPKKQGKKK